MQMLVLGGGQQGTACAYDLLTHTNHRVVLADIHHGTLPSFLQRYDGDRLTTTVVDAEDHASLREAVKGNRVVMSALPYYLNMQAARIAIEEGAHFCDLGGNAAVVQAQKEMAAAATARDVSVVADCGVAPGMVNILAELGIRALDQCRSVSIFVGGLPQEPEPPINYQVVYSLEGVLDYYTTQSWVLRDHQLQQVEALSEIEELDFPEVGPLEAFHTAGGLSLMAQRYEGVIERMEYKTMRYPGHAELMIALRSLGLFESSPVEVGDGAIVPKDVFIAVAGPRLRKDPRKNPDLVALRVEVAGDQNGESVTLRWDLVDRFDTTSGITAMMRCTGYSLAITGILQGEGQVAPGVWTPDEAMPGDTYVNALLDRGIEIRSTTVRSVAKLNS